MNALIALGSLRLTVALLVVLAASAMALSLAATASSLWIALPLLALAVNLCASLATHASLRRQAPLLMFHLALLALLVLAAVGQLTGFKGQIELAEGEIFSGQVAAVQAGPLHAGALQQVRFVNDGFSIDYAPGLKRGATRNVVRVLGHDRAAALVIGDHEPLLLEGYRFYTSFNKGFSLVFRWRPDNGAIAERGTVNLPAYPLHEHRQALEWKLPAGGPTVWTMLRIDAMALDPHAATTFRKPEAHKVVMRIGERRWELEPGREVALEGGVLAYEGLSTWMGYNVFYDWTLPWLIAACLTAIASLGWHFWRRFAADPWDAEVGRPRSMQ